MGNDLILAYAWTTAPEAIDFDKAEPAIAALTLDSPGLDLDGLQIAAEDAEAEVDTSDDAAFLEFVQTQVRADVAELRDIWGTSNRHTDRYRFGPVEALITGGDSYGDSPTEEFDVMTRIPESVYRAIGFFDWTEPETGVDPRTKAITIRLPDLSTLDTPPAL